MELIFFNYELIIKILECQVDVLSFSPPLIICNRFVVFIKTILLCIDHKLYTGRKTCNNDMRRLEEEGV